MAVRKITLTVCDVCESEKDVLTWSIGISGRAPKKRDLCKIHGAPIVAVLDDIKSGRKSSQPAPPRNGRRTATKAVPVKRAAAKKAAAPQRRAAKKVHTLEEIEAAKKS